MNTRQKGSKSYLANKIISSFGHSANAIPEMDIILTITNGHMFLT